MNALLRASQRNQGPIFAAALFAVLFVAFLILHPRGLSIMVTTPAANQGLALAFAAMAQTLPVLTGGLDLSVGSVLALSNCVASHLVNGSTVEILFGIAVTLLAGAACGFVNGLVVVAGRIQPIIATLATGAIFTGIAYLLRPIPGGSIDEDLGDLLTNETFGVIPTSLLLLAGVVLVVWLPFRNSTLGRGCYAAGSSETAAFLSGVRVGRVAAGGLYARGSAGSLWRPVPGAADAVWRCAGGRRLHAEVDRRRGHRRHLAAGRQRRGDGVDLRRLRAARHQRPAAVRRGLAAGAAAVRGRGADGGDRPWRDPHTGQPQPAGTAQRAGDRTQRPQPAVDPWRGQFRAGGCSAASS